MGAHPQVSSPPNALVGVAAHVRAVELIDLIASIAPVEAGKPGVKDFIDQALGPFFGRDKLATVLNALGPNWAVWAEPPSGQGFLPTIVAAVEIGGDGRGAPACREGAGAGNRIRRPVVAGGLQRQTHRSDRVQGRDEERSCCPVARERHGLPARLPPIVRGGQGLSRDRDLARADPAFHAPGRQSRAGTN